MILHRQELAESFYLAILHRAGGAIPQEDMDAVTGYAKKLAAMTSRFVGRKISYTDKEAEKVATALAEEISDIATKQVPEMIAAGAGEYVIYQKVNEFKTKTALLAEAHVTLRDQVYQEGAKVGDEVISLIANTETQMVILVAGASVVLLVLLTIIIISISRPLKRMVADVERLAIGDYSQELGGTKRKDEIGKVVAALVALQEFTANKAKKEAEAEMRKKALADEEKRLVLQQLANDFEQSVGSIVSMVASAATELSQTAESMVTSANDSANKAEQASDAAANTTSNVQMVAAASEELSATVQEISSQLQKTTHLVADSQEKARSADVVAVAFSDSITKVTAAMQMISNIAGQINLLSLNATIESARAGDAGKGFAVVASEVKNLANQTDTTTVEIQQVVAEMRHAADAIITELAAIGGSVGQISDATSSVAAAVEEQSATTDEIARNMQTAAASTQQISNNLHEVQSASSHAGSASQQMLSASQELSVQAEELNRQVNCFLERIRAS